MCRVTSDEIDALLEKHDEYGSGAIHEALRLQRERIVAALQEAYAEAEGIDIEAAAQFNEIIKTLVDD
jgi:hypothetical protein